MRFIPITRTFGLHCFTVRLPFVPTHTARPTSPVSHTVTPPPPPAITAHHLLLNVAPQLGQFSLPFLVEFDLRGRGSSGLVQPLAQLLQLTGLKRSTRVTQVVTRTYLSSCQVMCGLV